MRIVVNDIAASTGGALSILKDFYSYVKEFDSDNEWIFLLSDSYIEETEKIKIITLPKIKKNPLKKLWFDFVSGKKFISALNPDCVFSLQNIITFGLKAKQFVYIHQPLPFQNLREFSFFKKSERSLAIYQYLIGAIIKKSAKGADKIFVQTEWMRDAVSQKANVPLDKITCALPTVEDLSKFKIDNVFDNKKFFYPTAKSLYKNNDCIYKACEILDKKGYSDYSVKLTVDGNCDNEKIIHTGRIARENVINEYNYSTLIFPSYIETFGYPMAEARQIGTVVLASDCPFSREVLKDYKNAYFFNPFKPQELAELMIKVIEEKIVPIPTNEKNEKYSSWEIIVKELLGA